ncbi:S1C family serine protease [Cellulomonas sp. Marseille-Q8402]
MSSTPENQHDAGSTPAAPQENRPTEQVELPGTPDRAAATEAVPAAPTAPVAPQPEHPTQPIAPTPTQQLPQAAPPAPQAPAPTSYPAPYQHAAPQQPRYGQLAPQQQHPNAQQPSGDPLAVFRTPAAPGGAGGPGAPTGPEQPTAFGTPGEGGGTTTRTRTDRNRLWLPVAGGAVAAALLASFGTAALTGAFDDQGAARSTDLASIGRTSTDAAPVSGSSSENPDWQAVASAVQASVVAIQVTTSAGEAQGSGVIVDAEGHIVTNNHVVSGAQDDQVTVTLTDGRILTADVVGTDPTTDLAVIKLQDAPDDLTPAAIGDSGEVTVGDPVMAVGNPLGLANTVTTGIVSALDRPVSTTETGSNESVVTNAIQIDAAVNPGNSGGPLFDAQGRVIGITSSIATTSSESGSIGLGFAIPVNLADMVAGQLIEDGTAEHAFLGVGLTDNTATADGVTRSGAQVETITSGSPAADAGLQEGDVIVAIDGKAVAGAESLTGYVRAYASGADVTLTVVRDGSAQDVDVTLAVREETAADSGSGDSGEGTPSDPRDMTPDELWQWFQQQQGQG